MRILNVTGSYAPFYEFGGPPAKVEALSRGLAERGHSVTVLTADWGVRERVAATEREKHFGRSAFGWTGEERGVNAVYLPTWLRYRATSWNPGIGKFLRERTAQFDAAHIFGLYDLLGPAAAKACVEREVPYVVEPIGMFVPIVRNVRMKQLYHRWYGKKMLANAARVIATSEQEIEELANGGVPWEKIVLRRNGVMKPEKLPERGNFRRKYGISQTDLMVLFLGRLSEKKSPDLLLTAFAKISAKVGEREVRLVFAGPDEQGMEAKLKKLAKELKVADRVLFRGAVFESEKWAAYQDADVFVLPSQNENFGNTAAEAAAVGTPVIVTESCGVAPLLAEGGEVIPHDEGALTKALGELLRNETLRGRLGWNAMVAAGRIGWDGPVQEAEALYRKLAEKQ